MSQKTKDILLGTVATVVLLAGVIYLFCLENIYKTAVNINTTLFCMTFPIIIGITVYRYVTDNVPEKTTQNLWQKIGTGILYTVLAVFLGWVWWREPYDLSLLQLWGVVVVTVVGYIVHRMRHKTEETKPAADQLRTIAWLTIALYAYAVLTTVGYIQYFEVITKEQATEIMAEVYDVDDYPYSWIENNFDARQVSPLGYYEFRAKGNELPCVRVAVMGGEIIMQK